MDVMSIPSSVCSGVRDRKKETKKEKLVSLALATRERGGGGGGSVRKRGERKKFCFHFSTTNSYLLKEVARRQKTTSLGSCSYCNSSVLGPARVRRKRRRR